MLEEIEYTAAWYSVDNWQHLFVVYTSIVS